MRALALVALSALAYRGEGSGSFAHVGLRCVRSLEH